MGTSHIATYEEEVEEDHRPDTRDDEWDIYVEQYQEFREEYGEGVEVPSRGNHAGLAFWIYTQRAARFQMCKAMRDELDSINFMWTKRLTHGVSWKRRQRENKVWQENFEDLLKYKERTGGFFNLRSHDNPLRVWVATQRRYYKLSTLETDRKEKLLACGFPFETTGLEEEKWEALFQQVKANYEYNKGRKKTRDGRVALRPHLLYWIHRQRLRHKNGRHSPEQIEKLLSIGFQFETKEIVPITPLWRKRFRELKAFQAKHGHCKVPETSKALHDWVVEQRRRRKSLSAPITKEEIDSLTDLGFLWNWSKLEKPWEENFGKLKVYMEKHGGLHNPTLKIDDFKLFSWVRQQRRRYREGGMPKNRQLKLESINFTWVSDRNMRHKSTVLTNWEKQYHKMVAFREKHGHCIAPLEEHEEFYDKPLAAWVMVQRSNWRNDRLSDERMKLLVKVGFVWKVENRNDFRRNQIWDDRFEQIVKYKKLHGSCVVQRNTKLWDYGLARWTKSQRIKAKEGVMPESRKERLLSIGFFGPDDIIKESSKEEWLERAKAAGGRTRRTSGQPTRRALRSAKRDLPESNTGRVTRKRKRTVIVEEPLTSSNSDDEFDDEHHDVNDTDEYEAESESEPEEKESLLHDESKYSYESETDEEEALRDDEMKLPARSSLGTSGSKNTWADDRAQTEMVDIGVSDDSEEEYNSEADLEDSEFNVDGDLKAASTSMPSRPVASSASAKDKASDVACLDTECASVGARVAVYWSGDEEYYEGFISQKDKGDRCLIKYDDGESEWRQMGSGIRVLKSVKHNTDNANNHEIGPNGRSHRAKRTKVPMIEELFGSDNDGDYVR